MKVYVVIYHYGYETKGIEGVFDNEKDAESFASKFEVGSSVDYVEVQEFDMALTRGNK